ncbi:MAG: hypothetical protein QM483_08025 [Desulfuromusa sp.]
MTDLLVTIKAKAQCCDLTEVVRLMGYQRPGKALERLNLMLSAPNLLKCFDKSGFDFKYSNREFVLKLGNILDIPQSAITDGIEAMNREQVRIEKMFQPSIFINTKFKRQNQPIFVLAMLEGSRRINISKDDVLQNQTAELQRIKQIVINHYKKNSGELKLWGRIYQYIYSFEVNQTLAISPNGKVTNDDGYQQQKASLTLKGKDLCKFLVPD